MPHTITLFHYFIINFTLVVRIAICTVYSGCTYVCTQAHVYAWHSRALYKVMQHWHLALWYVYTVTEGLSVIDTITCTVVLQTAVVGGD